MDGKLGVAFGYARLDSPIATQGFGTYEPWKPTGGSGGAAANGSQLRASRRDRAT